MNWMPPKCMYIVQQKYQFKRISNQTPGILATIISSKHDEKLDFSSILQKFVKAIHINEFYSDTHISNILIIYRNLIQGICLFVTIKEKYSITFQEFLVEISFLRVLRLHFCEKGFLSSFNRKCIGEEY